MAAGSIVIDLLMKTGSFETDTDRAEKRLRKLQRTIDDAARKVGALATVGVGFGAAWFTREIKVLGDFKALAEQTGISVESLSAIEPVARGAGIELQAVADISGKLTKALAGVDDETKGAGKALAAIGLEAAKLQRLDPADQLTELARALNQYRDDANKVAIVQGVLGKTGASYLPFLKDLAEAGQLNASVTAEQARAADDYGKALAQLRLDVDLAARSVSLALLPSVRELLAELRDGIDVFGGFWAALRGVGQTNPFKSASEQVRALKDELERLREIEAKGSFGRESYLTSLFSPVEGRIRLAEQQLEYFKRREASAAAAGSGGILDANDARAVAKLSLPPFRRLAEDAASAKTAVRDVAIVTDEYAASLRRALAEEGNRRGVEEIRALADAEARRVDELDRLAELTGGLTSAQRERLQVVGELFAAERIGEQQLEALTADVYGLGKATEQAKGLAEELGFTFSSAFEDAIVGGKKFSEVLNALGQDLVRILTRELVTSKLANAVGSLLSEILPKRASGGPVSAGVPYLVGERGPELIVPRTAATVLDARSTASLGRGGEVTLNVMNYGAPVRAEQRARQTPTGVIVDLVLREVEGDVRRGGRVSSAMQQQFGLSRAMGLAR